MMPTSPAPARARRQGPAHSAVARRASPALDQPQLHHRGRRRTHEAAADGHHHRDEAVVQVRTSTQAKSRAGLTLTAGRGGRRRVQQEAHRTVDDEPRRRRQARRARTPAAGQRRLVQQAAARASGGAGRRGRDTAHAAARSPSTTLRPRTPAPCPCPPASSPLHLDGEVAEHRQPRAPRPGTSRITAPTELPDPRRSRTSSRAPSRNDPSRFSTNIAVGQPLGETPTVCVRLQRAAVPTAPRPRRPRPGAGRGAVDRVTGALDGERDDRDGHGLGVRQAACSGAADEMVHPAADTGAPTADDDQHSVCLLRDPGQGP